MPAFPNKQSFRINLAFKSCDHLSNSWKIYKFTSLFWVKDALSCFKQLTVNLNLILELLIYISFGKRLSFAVQGGLIFSFNNPLDSQKMLNAW